MTSPSSIFSFALVMLACSSESLGGADEPTASGAAGGASGRPADAGGLPELSRPSYPEGPYGRGVGATIANLGFLGWRDPEGANYDPLALEVVRLSDFYNPSGAADGVRIIALNASAVWCTVCRAEYRHFNTAGTYAQYRPKGVEIIGILFEDNDYNPAKPGDLVLWGGPNGYKVPFPLVLDPGFKSGVYFDSDATPMNMLIDATNMQILKVTMGYDSSNPEKYWQAIDAWLGN